VKISEPSKIIWHSCAGDEKLSNGSRRYFCRFISNEVKKRLERFGLNQITPKKGVPLWLRFLMQFQQPLVYILFGATITTLFLERMGFDASVIFGVVFIMPLLVFYRKPRP